MRSTTKTMLFWATLIVLAGGIWAWIWQRNTGQIEVVPFSDFMHDVDGGRVRSVSVRGDVINARYASESIGRIRVPASYPELYQHLIDKNVHIEIGRAYEVNWLAVVWPSVQTIALIVAMAILIQQIRVSSDLGKRFTKSPAKLDSGSRQKIRFADVVGVQKAISEMVTVVNFLREPAHFQKLGAHIQRGVLLTGPPGSGKTFLARATAGEANVPFFSVNGSEFMELFVGVGASRIRDLFNQGKMNAPCIVFIDEIDALARPRSSGPDRRGDEQRQALDQLLAELDGFQSNEGVIVLAATSRLENVDPALLRPGRFDVLIELELLDQMERRKVLDIAKRRVAFADNIDLDEIALMSVGFAAGDIKTWCNRAALDAAAKSQQKVMKSNFEATFEAVRRQVFEYIATSASRPFAKSVMQLAHGEGAGVRFRDVGGQASAKGRLQEVVEYLKQPERFMAGGCRMPRGVLLSGAPGLGKTLLARAVAGEAGVPFFFASGADFAGLDGTVAAAQLRTAFQIARRMSPSVVFIDHLDAIGDARGGRDGLNQILAEMDDFGRRTGVVVLAATNRLDSLDGALLRSGRFDYALELEIPNADDRREILKILIPAGSLGLQQIDELVSKTAGLCGADLENIINTARINAVRHQRPNLLEWTDLEYAFRAKIGRIGSSVT